ncbi:MAG: histidinol-phosphate transaminase [Caulobacteraceae bacterium]
MSETLDMPLVRPTPKPGILDIAPYVGGKSSVSGFADPIKLSSNENVLGCSPAALAAYAATGAKLHLYPDGHANGLRAAVAEKNGLEPERLIFGCGSDEIFTLLCQVYCEPGDNVVQGQYGFLAYRIAARAAQAEVRFAPEPERRIDIDEILNLVDDRTRIVFVANPSNPTGTWNSREEIARLHDGLPANVVLVLDGAYHEFVDTADYDDGVALARRAENIVVCRTFSKLYGLAALRVGWGYAPVAMIDALERIRAPFNVNTPAQYAAIAALGDEDFLHRSRDLVLTWRPWLMQQFGDLGLEVLPSQANFLLVRFGDAPGRTAAEAEAFLASRGILVRGLAGYGLRDSLRITVGLEPHNRAVVEALRAFFDLPGQA